MKEQLQALQKFLIEEDNTPVISLKFMEAKEKNFRVCLFEDVMHRVQHQVLKTDSCTYAHAQTINDLLKLESLYMQNQNKCWKSHEHHFHTSFCSYLNCPMTCLYEVIEFLGKIEKELTNA